MLLVKFWDIGEFIHYMNRQSSRGARRRVTWIKSAYPRAYYYLGAIGVAQKHYREALRYLETGRRLEPSNPAFLCEEALAHAGLGDHEKALSLYEQVPEVGLHVPEEIKAQALRGQGVQLVELGRLDAAEQVLNESLVYEPYNKCALDELAHVARLR